MSSNMMEIDTKPLTSSSSSSLSFLSSSSLTSSSSPASSSTASSRSLSVTIKKEDKDTEMVSVSTSSSLSSSSSSSTLHVENDRQQTVERQRDERPHDQNASQQSNRQVISIDSGDEKEEMEDKDLRSRKKLKMANADDHSEKHHRIIFDLTNEPEDDSDELGKDEDARSA
eukprot:TRINITY_DN444_c0_g1_i3.p1 TRINITY_DN444_c0_g1~~TRINITY_DN444_c0_g1_i3.p1  ORF type:complete len:171 (+),score=67.51 TRINITY_DN444_c0_g1_i3:224-736(+)